jgi:hypothetical protein
MLTRLWTIGVKVAELEQELAFHRRIGHDIVLDETVTVNERTFRVVLLRMGDKYLHLFEEAVYEDQLAEPLAPGPCHIVYISEDFELDIADIQSAGAHLLFPLTTIEGEFGRRRVAFFRSPGGMIFEVIRVLENRVPEV